MSLLQHALNDTLPHTPSRLEALAALIDPDWIAQALAVTGKASIRRRKLPAEHAVWLVIGLALFRHLPLWQVVQQLALSLDQQTLPAPSASVQARQRLGDEPMAQLFRMLTQAWNRAPTHDALRVLAVDGVVWCAQDTPENQQQLGRCATQHGALPWAQIRAVCLMDTLSHELLDAQMGGMDRGELTLAAGLQGQDHSITLFDRAYFSAAFLLQWQEQGVSRHWLMRAKDKLRYERVMQFSAGDTLIRMPVSPQARKQHPALPRYWQARLIGVEMAGRKRRYLTSVLDHQAYPAVQLAQLYAERWEIELGFREIKQSLQHAEPVLRSKQPDLVRQELWGVLIAYTLLRRWMREMAAQAKVEPRRISFQTASYAIVNVLCFASLSSAGTLPVQLSRLLEQSSLFVLPPRRPDRHCPRVVKNRAHKYPTKNASQR